MFEGTQEQKNRTCILCQLGTGGCQRAAGSTSKQALSFLEIDSGHYRAFDYFQPGQPVEPRRFLPSRRLGFAMLLWPFLQAKARTLLVFFFFFVFF